ncbi:kinase [Halobacteriovorax sp. HLS]|uniref:GHMP family kinase ATP-binding protein n=1 Tax=Halobacteriovorax sp. HLS TaxID=2234000 RepID=UPI000FDB832B|nr:kinase [Halobacteriovorax sp. HLS]
MIISKTPFRLSFFGGGTDYNSWFEENGGLIIGSTFDQYNYITLRRLPPFFEHKTRIVYSKTEQVNCNSEIEHPSVRNCLKLTDINDGLEIHYDGDLPARSGIGSSSSFTCGMLNALHAYNHKMISKEELAKQAIHVEQVMNNESVGIQDQILTAYGGLNIIEMGPGNQYKVLPLILGNEFKRNFESHIMLAFSGQTRFSSDNASKQINEIKNGSINTQMKEIHSIAKEGLGLFQKERDFKDFGKLFDTTWKIKRGLTKIISNSYIDDAYEIAIKNGAYGGRLLGAGGGGFMMFIAPPEKHQQIKEALAKNIKVWVPFKFEYLGSHITLYNPQ